MEEIFYFLVSSSTVVLLIVAVWIAMRAMKSGLTYAAWQATIWTLGILAVARIWHTMREIFGWEIELAEFIEYGLGIFAYVVYIILGWKAAHIKSPNDKK